MKKHLKLQHKDAYLKFEQKESERNKLVIFKRKSNGQSQPTIKEALRPSLYPNDSKKQICITRKLALFVGSTNVLLSLVDCPEFRELLKEMDKQYNVPHRKKLGHEIDQVYEDLKQAICLVLENAKRISFCSDIWSKQGMTASFLGSNCTLLHISRQKEAQYNFGSKEIHITSHWRKSSRVAAITH